MKGSPMQRNFGIGNSPMKQDQPKMGRGVKATLTKLPKQGLKESKGKLAKGFKEGKTLVKNPNQSKINKLAKTRDNLKDKGATIKGKNVISMRLRNVQNQINKLSGSDVKRNVVTGK